MVGNTPFKRYKQNVHWGGVRAPLVVHWPAEISDRGGLRTQFRNVIDLMPTVLEACGVAPPSEVDGVAQMSLHGTSMRYAFRLADSALDTIDAVLRDVRPSSDLPRWLEGSHVARDRHQLRRRRVGAVRHRFRLQREQRSRALSRPEKLAELTERWWTEAGRYDVLPLDDRPIHTLWRPAAVACLPDAGATFIARRSHTCRSRRAAARAAGVLHCGRGARRSRR